jgi:hypothetical protein
MTKNDMVQLLRSVGVDENTVTAMSNAFDLGFELARELLLADIRQVHDVHSCASKPDGLKNRSES